LRLLVIETVIFSIMHLLLKLEQNAQEVTGMYERDWAPMDIEPQLASKADARGTQRGDCALDRLYFQRDVMQAAIRVPLQKTPERAMTREWFGKFDLCISQLHHSEPYTLPLIHMYGPYVHAKGVLQPLACGYEIRNND
jgi:hypothetical protein